MRSPVRPRSWRQRFDAKLTFVYLKRLRLGDDPKKPYVMPGGVMTDETKTKLGPARLRRWWDSRVIGDAEFYSDRERKMSNKEPARQRTAPPPAKPLGTVTKTKGPDGKTAYDVALSNGVTHQVKKKKDAEALAADPLSVLMNGAAVLNSLVQVDPEKVLNDLLQD